MGGKRVIRSMVKKYLFFYMCVMALAGCSPKPASPEQAEKMTPPIETELLVEKTSLSSDTIKLILQVTFENSELKAKAILQESGLIKSAESGRTILGDWNSIQKGETFSIPFSVKAEGYGKGSIRVNVEAYDENGKLKYGMNPYKYFLVSKEEVLTGNNGYMGLEIQHLDHLKEQGKISNKEYEKRKEEIMKGN